MAELDEMIRGAFQEAGNIGMGHVAKTLSEMVNHEVKIDIPTTNSRNEFNMLFEPGASDVIMAAVMQKMMG